MNIPKLRFKEFEGEWVERKLKDYILSYKGGASLKPKDFVKKSNSEVIPKKAIMSNGKLNLDKENPIFCSDNFFNSNQKSVVDNSYLITTLRDLVPSGPNIGYIVKNYFHNKKFILAQGVYALKISKKLNESFLILLSNRIEYRRTMQRIMVGSTQVHIRNHDFFSIKINLPSLKEEQKIATFLSTIDQKTEQLTKKKTLLESYKKGVMQKIFAQQIRFKRDDGEEFEDWEEKRFKDIVDIIDGDRGINYPKSYEFHENEYCLFLSAKNVTKNGFVFLEKQFIDKKKDELLNKGKLKRFDIVLTTRGSVGYFAFYSKNIQIEHIRINSGMVILRTKDSSLLSEFLYKACFSYFIEKQIKVIAFGSAQPQLTVKDIKKIKIKIPSLVEQEKIATFLTSLDQKITQTTQQIEAMKRFKKGLLQRMFV